MSWRKRMKMHCVKKAQNLVGRLEASLAMVLRDLGGLRGYDLLKSMVFANAVLFCEKPCFLINS